MRFAFLGGGPSDALPFELRQLGHEVLANATTDWYRACVNHVDPGQYATRAWSELKTFAPDVVVLNKGFHGWAGHVGWWHVPLGFLNDARKLAGRSVYICYDDPAATPITLQLGLPVNFDLWLTTCPGIGQRMFPSYWPRIRAQVHEFWLAWDTRTKFPPAERWPEAANKHACDLAVTGTPYYRPFPKPHYQAGFGGPRRDLVHAALDAGLDVGLYGPKTWLIRRHGGDPRFAPCYRGWVDPSRIHIVHRAASMCLGTQLVQGHRYESGRLWVLGAGGCLIHENRPGLRAEFGNTVGWYKPGDVEGFMKTLTGLHRDPKRRQRMRDAGHKLVLAKHTWAHRARRLVELVKGI